MRPNPLPHLKIAGRGSGAQAGASGGICTPHEKEYERSLREVSQSAPLIVTANGGLREQTSYSVWGMRGFGGIGDITLEQNVQGTLIVDLYDAKSQSLVWRGIAQNTLNNNGNKNQQMIEKAIQKMFKQWLKF